MGNTGTISVKLGGLRVYERKQTKIFAQVSLEKPIPCENILTMKREQLGCKSGSALWEAS